MICAQGRSDAHACVMRCGPSLMAVEPRAAVRADYQRLQQTSARA